MQNRHTLIFLCVAILFGLNTTYLNTAYSATTVEPILLVSSSGTDSIIRYNATTGAFLGAFVPTGSGGLDWPEGIILGPDGNLYVSSFVTDSILRFNGKTGAFIDTFVAAGSGGLNGPHGLIFGSDGNIYSASYFTRTVLRFDGTTGKFIDVFAPTGGDVLKNPPTGIVFGPDNNLYVVAGVDVIRFNGTNGAYMDIFVQRGLKAGEGLTFGPDNNLYVSDRGANSIRRFNGATGAFIDTFVPPKQSRLRGPSGLAFGIDGELYVSNNFSNSILRYNGTNGELVDIFVPDSSGGLKQPTFLTFSLATKQCIIPPSGLISWWPADEGRGNTIGDIVSGNNGTLVKGTWSAGKVVNALFFNGVDDSVVFPDLNPPSNSPFTLETWINFSSDDSAIFNNVAQNWNFRWILGKYDSDYGIRLGLWNGGSHAPPDLTFSRSALTTNTWHHIAVVYNGSGQISFYIDGELDSISNWILGAPTVKPLIKTRDPGSRPFAGFIDEFSVYGRALSRGEIEAIFHADKLGKCKRR